MNNLLKYAVAGSIGLGSFALVILPRTAKNLKPLKMSECKKANCFLFLLIKKQEIFMDILKAQVVNRGL